MAADDEVDPEDPRERMTPEEYWTSICYVVLLFIVMAVVSVQYLRDAVF